MKYAMYSLLGLLLVMPMFTSSVCRADSAPWTLDQAVLKSAAQAWELAGKNDEQFAKMVQDMTALVAVNRALTIPDQEDLGSMVGKIVTREVKADRDQLLYVIVDHAVTVSLASVVPASMTVACRSAEAASDWSTADIATSTVTQAWKISGESRTEFMKMVRAMLALDVANRGMDFSDTRAAGMKFGELLRMDLEAHPNDLLYTVVDRSALKVIALDTIR